MNNILYSINNHYSNLFESMFGVKNIEEIHYHIDKSGKCWLNLDYDSKYPGGEIFKGDIFLVVDSN